MRLAFEVPGSFFNLVHDYSKRTLVNRLEVVGTLSSISVEGKRARSKHFSMTRSQMMAQILHEGECSHFHQDAKFASNQLGMWLFCRIGPCWRSMEFIISAVLFFSSESYQGCSSHLPLGFVGGAYERSGWCFVEACAVSCEHLTQTETLVTHLCFFRVCLMRRRARCRSEGLLHELSVCVGSLDTSRRPFRRSSSMLGVVWT